MGFPILTVLVLLPAGAALAVALAPREPAQLARRIGLGAAVVELALAGWMTAAFKTSTPGFQFVSDQPWVRAFGISWHLGVDGISLFLVLLTTVLFPLAIAQARPGPRSGQFTALMLLLESACLGSFLALDLFVFFAFFELTLVPGYFVIAGFGHERRQYAATKFFLYTLLGSAFLLVGIVALVFLHDRATGHVTFSLLALASKPVFSSGVGEWLFAAFTAAFVVKAPVFPFHTWSPDAYGEAPAAGFAVIAGVLAKLGAYGILRFDLELFPQAAVSLAPLLLTLAVVSMIYGAIVAARQRDLKRLVAYSSLSHMGFIVLGIFAFTSIGLAGGVLQMVNHGILIAALFFLVAMLGQRRSRLISELGGLQRPAPVLAAVFMVVMLGSIGLPALNGFVGEFMILAGTFITHRWWAVAGAVTVVLASVYLLLAYQRVFHGKVSVANEHMADMTTAEKLLMVPLVALIVVLGVYPQPLLSRINPSVRQLVAHVDKVSGQHQPAVGARPTLRYQASPAARSTR
ncbi:MAG: complex I subunit 4 family protein [Acidimicrobiales bacterium]